MGDTQTQTASKRQTLTRGQPPENLRKWRREVFNELVWDSKLPEQIKLKGGFDDVVRKAAGMTVPGNFMAFTPDELKTKALAAKIEDAKLGDPPWDSATEARALGLRATLDFESLPNASGAAEVVGGNHANPAFWVNQARAGGRRIRPRQDFHLQAAHAEIRRGRLPGGRRHRAGSAGRPAWRCPAWADRS